MSTAAPHRLDESLLANLPPFSQLERRQIREILDAASVRRLEEGAVIFEEGAPADRFYMLLDGVLRVVRITEGGEQVIALHIPTGQLFGIAKALARDTYPATSVMASEGIILSWPTSLWEHFIASYPGFATETYKTLGARVGEMNARIVEMATQHVEQRVANALLRLVNQTGKRQGDAIEIAFPITRQDLSEMTGTTLHTVSRLLSAWEKSGIVASRRKHISVLKPHALVELSQQPHR
ncbi:Crp/Fnr family transcriptional regulator [Pseudoruegeria sp. SHC-113]|uniref:Crp/Fnr family transcriptional regulator n=1 Tax=Pseudoruegeria sp. SHC-113 TaxID=2855439 RepID=UPI0021BB07EE|nr:Crp/Fnr family transcriptional regulator [Pseudoruegeria sp. SHC-113]MCT8160163.1 Crp/Fnr family transcriptional regulator [Pseudoruegeria sp. SHC-113]